MKSTTDHSFENVLGTLNESQLKAVTTTEGPVMVLAGPGTGKTQILAARAGQIMQGSDVDASNILCLTYTDAGAVSMRNRLIKFIGPEAHRVHIHTFHSFCNWVIQSNTDEFAGISSEPMSDLEKVEIVEQILNGLPHDHPLKNLKGSYRFVGKNLIELLDIMKNESWTAADIRAMHDAYLNELPNMEKVQYKRAFKGFMKGDVNERLLNLELAKVDKLVYAAELYESMEKEKLKRGLYDFSDMLLWVAEAFRNNENLLRDYQERFLYIMVDEFQDTSGSQQSLIYLLTNFWESSNIFVVGDDDQSIFRFQGANVQNIIDFHSKYDRFMTLVVLTDNYRSTQKILDTSKKLISHNKSRLINLDEIGDLNKDLISQSHKSDQPDIRIITYPNPIHEAVDIGKQIRSLIDGNVPAEEIAVIYRSHKESEEIIRYLRSHKVPIKTKRKKNILELSLVSMYIEALRFVSKEARQPGSGEGLLYKILHYDSNVLPLDMARISLWIEQERNEGRYHKLREVFEMVREGNGPALLLKNSKAIATFSENIERWITVYFSGTTIELAEKVLHKGGFVARALLSESKGFLLEALHTFFGFIQAESRKDAFCSIDQIIAKIDLMNEHGIEMQIEEIINDQSGVQFCTAHSAKGLEFGHVFIIGCIKDSWEKTVSKKPFGLHYLVEGDSEQVVTEENRRLFYVAMTRAKTHLTFSNYTHKLNGKSQERSVFITEIENAENVIANDVNADAREVEDYLTRTGQKTSTRITNILDDDLIESRLSNYHLSVTHLNNYLRCPIDFYFNGLLRVPSMKNKYMSYGTAVHTALDRMIKVRKADEYTVDYLLKQFERAMTKERSAFTEQEFTDMMQHGKLSLAAFEEKYHDEWLRPDDCITEKRIDNVLVNGVPIKGQLDKIELYGSDVNVVDYKTGKPENAFSKLKGPKEGSEESAKHEEKYGGDYWRQLVFYYLLVDGQKEKPWRMISGEMDFLEQNKKGEFVKHKWFIDTEDIETVRNQITDVYKKIMGREFSEGCNAEDCEWCEFVREISV